MLIQFLGIYTVCVCVCVCVGSVANISEVNAASSYKIEISRSTVAIGPEAAPFHASDVVLSKHKHSTQKVEHPIRFYPEGGAECDPKRRKHCLYP
jgi:hypothetical protein